jgi:hypothetical protein
MLFASLDFQRQVTNVFVLLASLLYGSGSASPTSQQNAVNPFSRGPPLKPTAGGGAAKRLLPPLKQRPAGGSNATTPLDMSTIKGDGGDVEREAHMEALNNRDRAIFMQQDKARREWLDAHGGSPGMGEKGNNNNAGMKNEYDDRGSSNTEESADVAGWGEETGRRGRGGGGGGVPLDEGGGGGVPLEDESGGEGVPLEDESEVRAHALALGIDPAAEPHLLWIARWGCTS